MSVGYKLSVVLVASETAVDVVIVRAGIPVVRAGRFVVLKQRGVPNCGNSQVCHIVELASDTGDVSSVPSEKCLLVHAFHIARNTVQTLVGIYKAIRHNKIYKVSGGEALALCRSLTTLGNVVAVLEALAFTPEYEIAVSGLGSCCNVHVHKEIVRAVGFVYLRSLHTLETFYADLVFRDIWSLDKQLQSGLHSGPPARRFNSCDLVLSGICYSRDVGPTCTGGRQHCSGGKNQMYLSHIHMVV